MDIILKILFLEELLALTEKGFKLMLAWWRSNGAIFAAANQRACSTQQFDIASKYYR